MTQIAAVERVNVIITVGDLATRAATAASPATPIGPRRPPGAQPLASASS
jgi:hypothetical protein